MGLSRAEAPYVSVPLNCVLQLVPSAFSCEEKVREKYEGKIGLKGRESKRSRERENESESKRERESVCERERE